MRSGSLNRLPGFVGLALDIGLAGFPLDIERIEGLIEPFLGGFAGVDGAADSLSLLSRHVGPPTADGSPFHQKIGDRTSEHR
jgi:hypothetical protein